jgi:RNA recognition motif-containing protein
VRIFIGNLSPETTQTQVEGLFTPHGQVTEVKLARNLQGQSRGFAFVTMPDKGQAATAMRALTSREHLGRLLTITEARPGSL